MKNERVIKSSEFYFQKGSDGEKGGGKGGSTNDYFRVKGHLVDVFLVDLVQFESNISKRF